MPVADVHDEFQPAAVFERQVDDDDLGQAGFDGLEGCIGAVGLAGDVQARLLLDHGGDALSDERVVVYDQNFPCFRLGHGVSFPARGGGHSGS